MKLIFADTYYFIALLSPTDNDHARVTRLASQLSTKISTTAWVLNEVADGLCMPPIRTTVARFIERMLQDQSVEVIRCDDQLYRAGFQLYSQRPDKEWSLTDCISFVVMQQRQIREALTADRHFEQAGFIALLK